MTQQEAYSIGRGSFLLSAMGLVLIIETGLITAYARSNLTWQPNFLAAISSRSALEAREEALETLVAALSKESSGSWATATVQDGSTPTPSSSSQALIVIAPNANVRAGSGKEHEVLETSRKGLISEKKTGLASAM